MLQVLKNMLFHQASSKRKINPQTPPKKQTPVLMRSLNERREKEEEEGEKKEIQWAEEGEAPGPVFQK